MNSIHSRALNQRATPAFSTEEKIILCATSLHHRRYIEDIIHVIGLPAGSHVRLRYRKPYVERAYWDMLNAKTLSSSLKALIAVSGVTKDGTPTVTPLRKGTIVSARCEGDLAIIDISLQEYIFTNHFDANFYESLTAIAKQLPNGKASSGLYLQPLPTPPNDLLKDSTVKGWEKVASSFFEIENTQSREPTASLVPFLYHIRKLGNTEEQKLQKTGQLFISMGDKCDIEIHTMARPTGTAIQNPLGEIVLELSHTAADFISSRRVRVDSSRDVKSIGLITTPLFSNADGHLSIRMNIFAHGDSDSKNTEGGISKTLLIPASKRTELALARYDFPLRVGGVRPAIACALIAGAAALSVYKFTTQGEFNIQDAVIPGVVFTLTFLGLSLGIIKK